MSYEVFFDFSAGLAQRVRVPQGTKDAIAIHVASVEQALGLLRTQYKDNPVHWDNRRDFSVLDNTLVCETVSCHNAWVRRLYADLAAWTTTPVPAPWEWLTPQDAKLFWHALEQLIVEPSQWTEQYYRSRMECLYAVMRGRETEGILWDVKALTSQQAAAVIRLFAPFLEIGDLRLDVPHGHDYLASSPDGGYEWCGDGKRGCYRAIASDDVWQCRRSVKKCPLKDEQYS